MTIATREARQDSRSLLLRSTLDQIRMEGPTAVKPSEICKDLRLSKAIVSYHFGSRGGLIAEVVLLGFEELVVASEAAVDGPFPTELDRLMAWFGHQVRLSAQNPGLASAISFPIELLGLDEGEEVLARDRAGALRDRRIATLGVLVAAAREERAPGSRGDGFDVLSIGWLCLGMGIWNAGGRTGEEQLDALLSHMRATLGELLGR